MLCRTVLPSVAKLSGKTPLFGVLARLVAQGVGSTPEGHQVEMVIHCIVALFARTPLAMHCNEMKCNEMHCNALHWICNAMHCIAMHCTATCNSLHAMGCNDATI